MVLTKFTIYSDQNTIIRHVTETWHCYLINQICFKNIIHISPDAINVCNIDPIV